MGSTSISAWTWPTWRILIVSETEEPGVGLVVMSLQPQWGPASALRGNGIEQVVRGAHVPVVLVPSTSPRCATGFIRRILVHLDGSARSSAILGPASELALVLGARVRLLRVFSERLGAPSRAALWISKPS